MLNCNIVQSGICNMLLKKAFGNDWHTIWVICLARLNSNRLWPAKNIFLTRATLDKASDETYMDHFVNMSMEIQSTVHTCLLLEKSCLVPLVCTLSFSSLPCWSRQTMYCLGQALHKFGWHMNEEDCMSYSNPNPQCLGKPAQHVSHTPDPQPSYRIRHGFWWALYVP